MTDKDSDIVWDIDLQSNYLYEHKQAVLSILFEENNYKISNLSSVQLGKSGGRVSSYSISLLLKDDIKIQINSLNHGKDAKAICEMLAETLSVPLEYEI